MKRKLSLLLTACIFLTSTFSPTLPTWAEDFSSETVTVIPENFSNEPEITIDIEEDSSEDFTENYAENHTENYTEDSLPIETQEPSGELFSDEAVSNNIEEEILFSAGEDEAIDETDNYTFTYGNMSFQLSSVPELNAAIGSASVTLDSENKKTAQITSAYWSSSNGTKTFKQKSTYLLTVVVENQENNYGKFTEDQVLTLKIGHKTYTGTASVSDSNVLTAQFSYTVDRVTSLSKTPLKSAECLDAFLTAVKWSKVNNATGYRIYRKTAGTSWKAIKTTSSAKTLFYRDSTVIPGQTYYYTVRAYRSNNDGSTTWGGYYSGLKVKVNLSAPKVTSVALTDSGIQIKWQMVTGATSYRIYRKTASSSWKYVGKTNSSTTVFYDNRTITQAGTYYYTVRGMYGDKVYGNFTSPGKKIVIPKLTAPKLVRTAWYLASPAIYLNYYATVKWNAVPNAQYYCIYRKEAGTSKWELIGKKSAAYSTSYTDKTANSHKSYYYTVRAAICRYYSPYNSSGIQLKDKFSFDMDINT